MRSNAFPPRILRLAGLLGLMLILITACSSGGDGATSTAADSPDGVETDSHDGPATDETIPPVINAVRVAEIGQSLIGNGVTPVHVNCVVDRAEGDSQLIGVLGGLGGPGYELTPEGYTALAVGFHACVEPEVLVDSFAGLTGGADDAEQAEFDACMNERISDEVNGDLTYTGVSALLLGLSAPEGAQDATLDALTGCVSSRIVASQLASRAEQEQGFAIVVGVDCTAELLDDSILQQYWESTVRGTGETPEIVDDLASCTTAFDSGLADELPADFDPFAGLGALSSVNPALRNGVYSGPPDLALEDGVDYGARITTTDGVIEIDLYEDTAPETVNNFVALARDGFYDSTVFHRVIEGFMAQAGDPSATGSGGPGYSFADEASGLTEIDRRGLLAMANSGPDTNGSQFFITFEAATHLNGAHTVFGEVTGGDDVLSEIDIRDPSNPTGRGEQLVSVEITEN